MLPLSRARRRLGTLTLVALSAITLAGCGGSPAASGSHAPKPSHSPSASATEHPTDDPSESPTATSAEPTSGDAQVVEVTKYGISFELPKGWMTLNARKIFRGGDGNPFFEEFADKLGMSPDQLVKTFSSAVQTLSITDEGAVHGFVDNVNSIGEEGEVNDDQFKLGLAAFGAKPGTFEHSSSPAGDVIRVPYTLEPKSLDRVLHGVAIVVVGDGQTVTITISSSAAARAAKIADQIQASLKKIPGTGPNL